jgi:hypothetical protein
MLSVDFQNGSKFRSLNRKKNSFKSMSKYEIRHTFSQLRVNRAEKTIERNWNGGPSPPS